MNGGHFLDIFKRILGYTSKHRAKMAAAILLLILLIGLNLITPYLSGILVDDVIRGGIVLSYCPY
jgi:ATP-binding cassette subfamily B multidrug efflux pump